MSGPTDRKFHIEFFIVWNKICKQNTRMSRTDLNGLSLLLNLILICDCSYVDASDGATIFGMSNTFILHEVH
jgi:hypothetical protein